MRRAAARFSFLLTLFFGLSGCVEPAGDGLRIPGRADTAEAPAPRSSSGFASASTSESPQTTLAAGGAAQSVPPGGCQSPSESIAWTAEVLRLTNVERTRLGLSPLAWSDDLAVQAEDYACELIVDDFFAHVNPTNGETLSQRARRFGYEYWSIGENLAGGQTTPQQVVAEWMASEGHRANILNDTFTELGIAVRLGGDYRIYWVQEFGRPLAAGAPQRDAPAER